MSKYHGQLSKNRLIVFFYLVNKSISSYLPSSDISLINKGDTSVVADAILLELMKKNQGNLYKNRWLF